MRLLRKRSMNTTLHPFKRRDIPDVLSRALKRAHGGIPETLTGRAFSKVKVWFIDRYRYCFRVPDIFAIRLERKRYRSQGYKILGDS